MTFIEKEDILKTTYHVTFLNQVKYIQKFKHPYLNKKKKIDREITDTFNINIEEIVKDYNH